jgi:hypothetical protein
MPTGRIPYAGRAIDSRYYDRDLLELMQLQSQQDQQYRREQRLRSEAQWNALSSLPVRLYETYRGVKDQQRARALQEQADKAARGMTLLQSLQGASAPFIESVIGPQIPPVTYEDGVIGGGIESIPPYKSEVHPAAASRIIPPVTPGVEGGPPGGGVEALTPSLPGGELPIRTERPPHVLHVPQPGLDAEGNPFPPVPYELVSREKQDRAALDLRQQAQQDIVDTEARRLVADKDLLRTEAGIAAGVAEAAQGNALDRIALEYGFDEQKATQAFNNSMRLAGFNQSQANFRARQGFIKIDEDIPHPDPNIEGNVLALLSKATGPGGNPIIFYPPGPDGQPMLLPVDPDEGEKIGVDNEGRVVVRYKDGSTEVLKGVFEKPPVTEQATGMVRDWVVDVYSVKPARNEMIDGTIRNLSLHGALQSNTAGISGLLTKPAKRLQQAFDWNPEAQKLRDELNIATENFSTIMTQMGEYRSSSQAVKNVLERLGDLEGGIFAGDETLRARANAWLDVADGAIKAHTAQGTIDYDNPTSMAQLHALITSALYLQDVLGMPNRKLIGAKYLTSEESEQYRPGGRSGGDSRIPVGTSR